MEFLKITIRNLRRHPLRSALTALGIAVALFAFTMIRTLLNAWYAGVEATAKDRLVVRNAVSLMFPLPVAYGTAIARVAGISRVGYGNWFGGIYKDKKYQSAQFAVDDTYLDLYPEYLFDESEKQEWLRDRKGILVGEKFARDFDIRVGEPLQLTGTIFPGLWEFTVRGVFRGSKEIVDTRVLYFHWDYLNERNKREIKRNPDYAGFYVVQLEPGANPGEVSHAIDRQFANSFAETLTETETAFVQGFLSMSSAIIFALKVVSGVVIGIMLLVLANTILMSSRERQRDYAILKSLGFESGALAWLVLGEAGVLCSLGLVLLSLLLLPVFLLPPEVLLGGLAVFFPVFVVPASTLLIVGGLTLFVALSASVVPVWELYRLNVCEGLRRIA